jgi:chitin disaccharide deacetylase
MKQVFNADDYGWDNDVNQAVLQLCAKKKLQGVSIMANFADADSLAKLLPFQEKVRCGLHVVLNEGKPVSNPSEVASLVDENGDFYSSNRLFFRYLCGKVKRLHIEREIHAQFDTLQSHGFAIIHADSHQHLHHFPFIGSFILKTLKGLGIKTVRYSRPSDFADFRRILLFLFTQFTKSSLNGFAYNQQLVTYLASKKELEGEGLANELMRLNRAGLRHVEIMCHPALADKDGCYLQRKREFELLL